MYQLASYTLLAFFLSSVSAASELASCAHDDLACNLGTDADGILEQVSPHVRTMKLHAQFVHRNDQAPSSYIIS